MKAGRKTVWLSITFVGLLLTPPAARAQMPIQEMRDKISQGVDYLVSQQQPNGSWPYMKWTDHYEVGMTALATLALTHTRLAKATDPARRGLAFITQSALDPKTYTSGLMEMLLFESGPTRYNKLIDAYAWMLIMGQKRDGATEGAWFYYLPEWVENQKPDFIPPQAGSSADHSNTQFGVLGIWYAQRAGFQVPLLCWQRIKRHYERTQLPDGCWSYEAENGVRPSSSMTPASTVSLFLADEALSSQKHNQCKMVPENPAVEKGMKAVAGPMGGDAYTWYAIERLGIMTGRSEFGGKNWMELGARELVKTGWGGEQTEPNTAFVMLFLARALEPVIINKLKRKGDWNNDPYDLKHLTEFIGEKYQYPKQWRIITLDASVEEILKVPILYITGHDALEFTDAEKAKLKDYVNRGGTIFGMACCAKKEFDKSFRSLVAELWPDGKLLALPKDHTIFTSPRPLAARPAPDGLYFGAGQGRLAVIYCPTDLCCRWTVGGNAAKSVLEVGANIYFFTQSVGARQGGVREGETQDTARQN